MAKKERTPEEIAERKARSQAKRKAKRDSLMTVIKFVNGRKNVPDEVKAAVKVITPGQRVGGGGPSKLKVFGELFTENASVSEADIFGQFKMGRGEMRRVCVQLIKKNKPEDRIWVRLDTDAEEYVVEGFGADAPADWTGYQPVDVEDVEIV